MASAGVAVRLPGAVGSGAASDCAAGTGSDHAFYLTIRGNVRVPGSLWVWGAFCVWVVVAALALTRSTDMIGWGLRFVNILSAGIYALYYYNARSSISLNRLLGGLATLWVTLIVLGYGGVLFPEFRLRTPMSFIMPSGFMQNPLVRDYMLPPLAEVQRPWGAPEAYIRPSAPFPTRIVGVWRTPCSPR